MLKTKENIQSLVKPWVTEKYDPPPVGDRKIGKSRTETQCTRYKNAVPSGGGMLQTGVGVEVG